MLASISYNSTLVFCMAKPEFIQAFTDKLHLFFYGGLRVRLWFENGALKTLHCGTSRPVPPDRLLQIIRDLKPDESGMIDFYPDDNGRIRCEVSGDLAADTFPQRLRNTIVNLY